jgi:hypothetical protein
VTSLLTSFFANKPILKHFLPNSAIDARNSQTGCLRTFGGETVNCSFLAEPVREVGIREAKWLPARQIPAIG